MEEGKKCILCKEYCDIGCIHCKQMLTCLTHNNHNRKCQICNTVLCGTWTPGELLRWYSKKTESYRCVCTDCLFDGALYVYGLMNFNKNTS